MDSGLQKTLSNISCGGKTLGFRAVNYFFEDFSRGKTRGFEPFFFYLLNLVECGLGGGGQKKSDRFTINCRKYMKKELTPAFFQGPPPHHMRFGGWEKSESHRQIHMFIRI